MSIKIITDSTCDLPHELFKKFDIDIVTMYIILDEKNYKERIEINQQQVIDWSNKYNKSPKTGAPTVDDFLNVFEKYADTHSEIIFIGTSGETTVTCQAGRIAADMLPNQKITIIDGRSLTCGTALLVYEAGKMAQNNKSADEIIKKVNEMIPKVFITFLPEKLDFLRRGGRCSALQYFAATSLSIKMEIIAKDGFLVPGKKYRGSFEKVIQKYFEDRLKNLNEIESDIIFIGYTIDNANLLPLLIDIVKSKNYFKEVIIIQASCIVTAHSGPNTYSLAYMKKDSDPNNL
ncbi:MAG: DegV family protein [Eubacteriales bacterium]